VGPAERESSDQQRASTKSLALARRCVRVVDATREEPLTKVIYDDGSMSVIQIQFWVSSQGWESFCRHLTGCSSGIKANTETLADMERWWVENPGTSTTTLYPLRRSPPNRNHPLSQLWQSLFTLLQDSLLMAIARNGANHTIDNVFCPRPSILSLPTVQVDVSGFWECDHSRMRACLSTSSSLIVLG
jgi:hypothetical protein